MEKFDLKVAATLLPIMDGTESKTRQLIEGIELYDTLLDKDGKNSLTNYILKTRLNSIAKIKLKSTYSSNTELVKDLKTYCIIKQSACALSAKLHTIKQGSQSISDYGKTIEDLMINLTLSQANEDDNKTKTLNEVNERIAINSFANGLSSGELRTIIKARNYINLSAAIQGALDEEMNTPKPVFHARSIHSSAKKGRSQYGYTNNYHHTHRGKFRQHPDVNRTNKTHNNYRQSNLVIIKNDLSTKCRGDKGDSIKNMLESVMTKLDKVLLCQGTFENRLLELEEKVNKMGLPSGQAAHNSIVSPVVPTISNVVQNNSTTDSRRCDRMTFSHNLKIMDLIPKFDDRHGCPAAFLISIKRVTTADTTDIQLYNILRSSLVNDAVTWFSVVDSTFSSFDEFEALFLHKFWLKRNKIKLEVTYTWENLMPEREIRVNNIITFSIDIMILKFIKP
ncbi:n-acetyltransferase-related [Holotrichia oblita]|uniref:N-acetyltransferase-related n=1 Tax=Holotrichia oblita TaxID=644536 RepID=A0ACB9TEJ0_HOLOL|nr:n-acetyltransferase-related [Holotrichia oblita]